MAENDHHLSALTLSPNPKKFFFCFFSSTFQHGRVVSTQECLWLAMRRAGLVSTQSGIVLLCLIAPKCPSKNAPWVIAYDLDLKVRRKWRIVWIFTTSRHYRCPKKSPKFKDKKLNGFIGNLHINICWSDKSMNFFILKEGVKRTRAAAVVRSCKNNGILCPSFQQIKKIKLNQHTWFKFVYEKKSDLTLLNICLDIGHIWN